MSSGISGVRSLPARHTSKPDPSVENVSRLEAMLIPAYSHPYRKLPLVPAEEFLARHPELVEADENELMIARINEEYTQREALEQARQGLLKKKQSLIADNKKRRDDLANLDRDLEKFIDVR